MRVELRYGAWLSLTVNPVDYLRAEGLSLQLGQRDLFEKLSLTLKQSERIGLIGRNGAGKTTLLRVLAGELKVSEGVLSRSPGLRLSYAKQTPLTEQGSLLKVAKGALRYVRGLEQALRDEEKRLADGEGSLERYAQLTTDFETAGGYRAESELETLLFDFGFIAAQFEQPLETLSGGEHARLKLVMAVAAKPDVLFLDEPSNHLDLATKRTLGARLAAFPNALLLASHDRALLDAVCTHIAELKGGRLNIYKGSYTQFRARRLQRQRSHVKRSKERAKTVAHLQAAQTRLASWGTPKAQRQRKQIDKRLEALVSPEQGSPESEPKAQHLRLGQSDKPPRGRLLKAQHLSKAYKQQKVVDDVTFALAAGDKVALVGPNGSGKSTLLGLISGELESEHPQTVFNWHTKAKLAVFDQQERGVSASETPLSQLERFVSRPRAEQLLALVGLPQLSWASLPGGLSGGERARLGLALLIASEANVILLDEPTNDLDIAMIETLESTLKDTSAAVLFTSHDERLIEHVATRVWSLDAGKLLEYRGGVDGYFGAKLRVETVEPVTADPVPASVPEVSLEALELERTSLEAQLLDPLLLTERELLRLKKRYSELLDSLSLRYDDALPAALPRYAYTVSGVTVTTNGFEADNASLAQFESSGGWGMTLFRPEKSGVGHLKWLEKESVCSLMWARMAALEVVTRLAFERLDVSALQLQTKDDLEPLGFKSAGNDWWVLSLSEYEERLGYPPPTKPEPRKKKRRSRRRRRRAGANTRRAKSPQP